MNKKTQEQLRKKLKQERERILEQLNRFTFRTPEGEFETDVPDFGTETMDEGKEADEAEEFGNLLGIVHELKNRLREINQALQKIKKGTYGKCESCQKEIEKRKLEANPATRKCIHCEK